MDQKCKDRKRKDPESKPGHSSFAPRFVASLDNHVAAVLSLSATGGMVVSGDQAGRVRIWELHPL